MPTQQDITTKLKRSSKTILKVIIGGIGLKKKHEEVLRLYYIEEKSYYEISEIMSISWNSVGNLLTKARKQLAHLLRYKDVVPDDIKDCLKIFNDIEKY